MLSIQSIRPIPLFAILGAVSGIVTAAIMGPDEYWPVPIVAEMFMPIFPQFFIPGLVFGLIIGLALLLRGWASPAAFVGYVAAATACDCGAVGLAAWLLEFIIGSGWFAGIAGGLLGSASLTAMTMVLVPAARGPRPFMLTVVAGGLLGALLGPAEAASYNPLSWFVFYGAWQAGYAASLATALPRR